MPKPVHPGTSLCGPDHHLAAISAIWREILGVPIIDPADDFFVLGGTPLHAAQMRARVRERMGLTAAVHILTECPTLHGFAEAVRPPTYAPPPGTTSLVPLKPGVSGICPLFLVQPIAGTVFTYLPLTRLLAYCGVVYGVRAAEAGANEPILDDVTSIAARAIADMRHVQPQGPYLVGGHSTGAIVAFEVAHQLAATDAVVQLLIFDAPSMSRVHLAGDSIDDFLREHELFFTSPSETLRAFVSALAEDTQLRAVVLASCRAVRRYHPPPLTAAVVYFAADEQRDAHDPHSYLYWMSQIHGPFTLHRVPGDRFSMMDEPWVTTLARLLAFEIAR